MPGVMVTGHGIFMRVTTGTLGKMLGLAGLTTVLCACGSADGRYPSLALRPFETAPAPLPVSAPDAPIRSIASDAAIAALVGRANAAHGVFTGQQAEAERFARAAAGQSIESNARARALVTLASLSSQRGATSAVLADLDLLVVQAASALAPYPAIASARAEVAALVESEDATMARLWETMGS